MNLTFLSQFDSNMSLGNYLEVLHTKISFKKKQILRYTSLHIDSSSWPFIISFSSPPEIVTFQMLLEIP